MKKRRIIVNLLLFLLVFEAVFSRIVVIKAAIPEGFNMVRVGLTKEYYNKPSIRLDNSVLKIGFSKKDVYYQADVLRSNTGISISRDYGSYNVFGGSFTTYAKAAAEAANLKAFNKTLTAVPALIGLDKNGRGVWKLYDAYSADASLNTNDVYQVASKNKSSKYLLSVNIGNSRFLVDVKEAGANPQFEPLNRAEGVSVNNEKRYRGRIEVGTYGRSGVTPVNVVNLEEYIRGSVPLEMSHSWNISALKAQAVCARSFGAAVSGFGSDGDIIKGYKLTDTISHQSYGGMKAEKNETDKACKDTENEFVTYKNKVVKTTYFSTSGGYTESSENVWGGKKPWLRSVPDPYENKPEKKPWTIGYTRVELQNMLRGYAAKKGVSLGSIEKLTITNRSKSGRALSLLVKGSRGRLVLNKQEIRKAFNLYSTKINIYSASDSVRSLSVESGKVKGDFIFSGSGYGHGVGLSQSGARGMAEAGYGYKRIIMYYFTGVEVH